MTTDPGNGISGYELYRSEHEDGPFSNPILIEPGKTGYTDMGRLELADGSTSTILRNRNYYYKLAAVTRDKERIFSETIGPVLFRKRNGITAAKRRF